MISENTLTDIHHELMKNTDETFAKAYGLISSDGEISSTLIKESGDVYDLIDSLVDDRIPQNSSYDFIAIVTYGWAAPLNEDGGVDGAPSKHPQKRRVRLTTVVGRNHEGKQSSILNFSDTDELIFDHGSATGSLADAMNQLF